MNAPTPLAALADIDTDPQETAEWREAFLALAATEGPQRARFVLEELARLAREQRLGWQPDLNTPYLNSVSAEAQPLFPGDLALEERLASIMRWNALAMVVRANQAYGELGGHIASYASAADLFETGFHHFFHGREGLAPGQHRGDLVFFQPHSAPGVYARAFLEGRLDEQDLQHYRQEIGASAAGAQGLSSYPHPWLMPDFWQFPTGSMGIGPISSIYHARFMRYLTHRHLLDCQGRKVWGVFGDGEMDEPESMSALTLAAREGLDNLVWVVNCNLQRLDGPVRGNGRIVDELERLFAGAGWNVVKLLWGSDWDGLFARDLTGTLAQTLGATVDGQMQTFAAKDGRYNREHFFGQSPELAALAQGLTDEQIDRLKRGGHDLVKIHAAYAAAAAHRGQPTVILAHTKKGYGMGSAGQGKMTTHSQKKLDDADLIEFRNRFNLPLSDEQAKGLAFHKPAEDSAEMQYLRARRAALGGALPRRETVCDPVPVPPVGQYAQFALAPGGKEMSTTMAFVRMLGSLLKDAQLGPRIVPIVADEARTFGMANLFRQIGIYSAQGQLYEPEDIGSVLYYREARDGQILEEGITEAGAISSWTAAGTSYSVNGLPMLPFYIYYSMFGFQRIGDLIWAAADQRTRGFLVGATSGRTTLGGEGLQHQDGSSHIMAAAVPNCRAYDPAYAYEVAIIVEHGMRRMLDEQRDEFYYLTVTNENLAQPDMPAGNDVREGILRGMYRLRPARGQAQVRLLGAGPMLREAELAAERLQADYGVDAEVWSVTSFSELARDGREAERARVLGLASGADWVRSCLGASNAPVVAASDYVRAVPEQIRAWVPAPYRTLGTDGFGRSDTRAQLRDFFEVSADWIVLYALDSLDRQEDALALRGSLNAGARQTPPWDR
jgi:pyruvate dehydrogenase E1 component